MRKSELEEILGAQTAQIRQLHDTVQKFSTALEFAVNRLAAFDYYAAKRIDSVHILDQMLAMADDAVRAHLKNPLMILQMKEKE